MRFAFALVFVLAAGVARAGNNELSIGFADRPLRSRSADAVTGDTLSGAVVGYGRLFGRDLGVPGLELWAGGGLDIGTAQGTMFQTLTSQIESDGIVATVRARYAIFSRVAATARVSLGAAHTSLSLTDESGLTVSDASWAAVASAAAGLDAVLLRHVPYVGSFAVRAELGYARTSAPALTMKPDGSNDGTLHLPMTEASIGHLDLSGPFVAITFLSEF